MATIVGMSLYNFKNSNYIFSINKIIIFKSADIKAMKSYLEQLCLCFIFI